MPDVEIRDLQRRINNAAVNGRVTFIAPFANGELTWAVIYQHGARRATVPLGHRPSEADLEEISTALASWATYGEASTAYTTEVPRDEPSRWG